MMDELISKVSKKMGLSPDQARSAAETVLQFLQTRFPAPLASKATAALGGLFGQGKPAEEPQ